MTTWTAPTTAQTCTLRVTVTDDCGIGTPARNSSVSASLQVLVLVLVQTQIVDAGTAEVHAHPNTCPATGLAAEDFLSGADGKVDGYTASLTSRRWTVTETTSNTNGAASTPAPGHSLQPSTSSSALAPAWLRRWSNRWWELC